MSFLGGQAKDNREDESFFISNYKQSQILKRIFLFRGVRDGYHIDAMLEIHEENEMVGTDKIQAESASKD